MSTSFRLLSAHQSMCAGTLVKPQPFRLMRVVLPSRSIASHRVGCCSCLMYTVLVHDT